MQARGEFKVDLQPLDTYMQGGGGTHLGRLSLDKTFTGDLEGQSKGEMLSAITEVEGSAGYVALELVNGTLNGKQGTFVLQHYGINGGAAADHMITVVPDSATAELAGLVGRMEIAIENDTHHYTFEYELNNSSNE